MLLPRYCHTLAMLLPYSCYVFAMFAVDKICGVLKALEHVLGKHEDKEAIIVHFRAGNCVFVGRGREATSNQLPQGCKKAADPEATD